MSWKKITQDPEKLMQYRRPAFMTGVFLTTWAQLMQGQVLKTAAMSTFGGYVAQFYSNMAGPIKQMMPTNPLGNLTSLPDKIYETREPTVIPQNARLGGLTLPNAVSQLQSLVDSPKTRKGLKKKAARQLKVLNKKLGRLI